MFVRFWRVMRIFDGLTGSLPFLGSLFGYFARVWVVGRSVWQRGLAEWLHILVGKARLASAVQ